MVRWLLGFLCSLAVLSWIEPAQADTDRFVMLRRDARFHVKPDGNAAYAHGAVGPDPNYYATTWAPYRFVARRGEFVEIETLERGKIQHCHDVEWGLDGLRLRLFVKATDLVPVVSRRTDVKYRDGSGLTIYPGQVVVPVAGKANKVIVPALDNREVAVPRGSIGVTYAPERSRAEPLTLGVATGKLDGRDYTDDTALILEVTRARGGSKVRIRHLCHDVTIVTRQSRDEVLRSDSGAEAGGVIGGFDGDFDEGPAPPPDRLSLPAATRLYHPDGAVAGETFRTFEVERAMTVKRGRRLCWPQPVTHPSTESSQKLLLCFDHRVADAGADRDGDIVDAKPQNIAPTYFEALRTAGDREIPAPAWVEAEAKKGGYERIIVVVKLCLDARGGKPTVQVLKGSKWPKHDAHIQREILKRWRFSPFQSNGRKRPVCSAYTLIYKFNS